MAVSIAVRHRQERYRAFKILYDSGWSDASIARVTQSSALTVCRWREREGLDVNFSIYAVKIDYSRALALYHEGASDMQIGRAFGATQSGATRWRQRQGLPLKPSPVNNARDDKLLNPFWPWKESFERRRCLIPLTAWAEAEGEKGKMTATWYSLPDTDLFSVGGIWQPTDEWGDAYSMVMVDGSPQMSDVHDRMPVILLPDQREQWLRGSVDDALALTRTYAGELAVHRSGERWGKQVAQTGLDSSLI